MKRVTMAIIVILATAAGLAGGLFYTWVLDPIEYYDTAPGSLRLQDKIVYLALIGDLYAYEEDLVQAQARLAALDVQADGPTLVALMEQYLDSGGQPERVRNLARLAEDLGATGGVLLVFGAEPTPTTAATPSTVAQMDASPTPPTPATPSPSFRLVEQTAVCADVDEPGKITVWVRNAEGIQLPGVEVVASWAAGQDRFFTGLRPELGAGYADFEMSPEIEYDVALAGFGGEVAQGLISDLSPGICPTSTIALSWKLIFERTQ